MMPKYYVNSGSGYEKTVDAKTEVEAFTKMIFFDFLEKNIDGAYYPKGLAGCTLISEKGMPDMKKTIKIFNEKGPSKIPKDIHGYETSLLMEIATKRIGLQNMGDMDE